MPVPTGLESGWCTSAASYNPTGIWITYKLVINYKHHILSEYKLNILKTDLIFFTAGFGTGTVNEYGKFIRNRYAFCNSYENAAYCKGNSENIIHISTFNVPENTCGGERTAYPNLKSRGKDVKTIFKLQEKWQRRGRFTL